MPSSAIRIRRAFVTTDDRQIHYRYAGTGPVVVLIGQSPTTSRMLDKQTQAFAAAGFTAIALDAPGLGRSTPHAAAWPDVTDQAVAMAAMLDELGVQKIGFYGSHSGASIGLEFAKMYPERTSIALLEGLPIYNDLERNLRMSTYFPEYEDTWDGLHLMWLWYRYREQNVFWPWNIRGRGARGPVDIPSAQKLHNGVVDILEVGNGYIPPYAAVFKYRAEDAIPHLKVPTHFLAYPDDSLLPALRHLPALPPCAVVTEMPLDKDAGVAKEIELLHSIPVWDAPRISHRASVRQDGSVFDYVEVSGLQLAVARYGVGKGNPMVILPPAPGSVTQLAMLPAYLGRKREVIAIDLPGCGYSDAADEISVEGHADLIAEAMETYGLKGVDLYAKDGAAAIALTLKARFPDLVGQILLDNPPILPPEEREEIATKYARPIEIEPEGTHLVKIWHATRDQELYWPWYNHTREGVRFENDPQIDPKALTIEVAAYLKNHQTYAPTWKAVLSFPLAEALAEDPSVKVCAHEDGRFTHLAKKALGDRVIDLPNGALPLCDAILKAFAKN